MKKQHLVLIFFGIIFLMASGCGGGGGGGGRYTLPGEIPSGSPGTPKIPETPAQTDPNSLIASGWDDFKLQAYSSAISKFNQVLMNTNITDAQKAEAYNGLGWAQAKSSGLESAFNAFSQAAPTNNESRIGLAAIYLQRGQKSTIAQAVQLLETVGFGDTAFKFQPTHPIGVSNAEGHAMIAFCYAWRNEAGDADKARAQIATARAEDPAADSSVGQIYSAMQKMGF